MLWFGSIPTALRSKAWVCCHSLAGIAVSNPAIEWMSVLCVIKREVSPSDRPLVQRSPTECGVSECDREASIMGRPEPTRNSRAVKERSFFRLSHTDSIISQ